jgi:biopolymer transport protein ExbB
MEYSFLDIVAKDFWHFFPLLFVAVFALGIIIERCWVLYLVYPIKNTKEFFQTIRELVVSNRLHHAIAFCEKYKNKPVSEVVKEALFRAHQPEEVVETGMEIVLSELAQKVQKRVNYLSSVANMATLLGLFGTILGLITAFSGLGDVTSQERSALLAIGISTALYATIGGIGIAIPCMFFYSLLTNQVNKLTAELEQGAYRAVDILRQRLYSGGARHSSMGEGDEEGHKAHFSKRAS